MAKHKTKVNKNKVRFANEETKKLLNQLDKTYFQDRMLSELDTAVKDAFRNDQKWNCMSDTNGSSASH